MRSGTWRINENGYLENAQVKESPNQDERPFEDDIRLIVLHCISLPPGEFGGNNISDFFLNRINVSRHPYLKNISGIRVSAHFLIDRLGEITQFVSCKKRAWHAGRSVWRGESDCNDFSIGIELEGTESSEFTDNQYSSLVMLVKGLKGAYPIYETTGHETIATPPGRKRDPGACFDWGRFYRLLKI